MGLLLRYCKRFLTLTTWCISEQSESISKMSSLEMELDAGEENLGDDILSLSTADIQARARLMDNEVLLGF